MRACKISKLGWRDPVDVLAGWPPDVPAIGLVSGGSGRWSYLARDAEPMVVAPGAGGDPFAELARLLGERQAPVDGPPFCGGLAGMAGYGLGARIEEVDTGRLGRWPDLAAFHIDALLAFDHGRREVFAIGRGAAETAAAERARTAESWMAPTTRPTSGAPLAAAFEGSPPAAFMSAVEDVRDRIAAGEIFQANIARAWHGRLEDGIDPSALLLRLAAQSPAPYAAWLRLERHALVSNSPEQFISVQPAPEGLIARSRPIKGTAPRGASPEEDAVLTADLSASSKDRAENLMIVDLIRNDLSRVSEPGTVRTPELFAVETFANVHHLVSTVQGRLRPDSDVGDLLRSTFPPGSITGAPKVQAMKVIGELEPPRGPFFGAMFWAGFDGGFDSSVLIRTVAFSKDDAGWAFEARAGGGIVADSDPAAELAETEAKISAIRRGMTEPAA